MIADGGDKEGGGSSGTYYRAGYKQDESAKLDCSRRKASGGRAVRSSRSKYSAKTFFASFLNAQMSDLCAKWIYLKRRVNSLNRTKVEFIIIGGWKVITCRNVRRRT